VIGLVLYATNPDELAAFYGALFEMERADIDGSSFTLERPGIEIHVVKVPDAFARSLALTTPPDPREITPLKFSFQVDDIGQLANSAQNLGGIVRGEAWNWKSRRHQDIVDPEGNIFQVFELRR